MTLTPLAKPRKIAALPVLFALFAALFSSLFAPAAQATPADFADRLPATILDMRQVKHDVENGDLIALYESSTGRATVRVTPAPEADPSGAWARGDLAPHGVTPSSERMLMLMMADNLAHGTRGLGEGYVLTELSFETMTLGDVSAHCALALREQPGKAAARLMLRWRLCAAQSGADVVTISVQVPAEASYLDQAKAAQLAFAREVLGKLLEPSI